MKCEKCIYYHKENNTCQSKKCCTGGTRYITIFDKICCKPLTVEMLDRSVNSITWSNRGNKTEGREQ